MTSFIQLSDLHISSDNSSDENIALRKIVTGVLDRFVDHKPVVMLTGDLVDDGSEDQYSCAIEILKPLVDEGFKLLACPGNHDYGPKGNIYTEAAQNRFQQFILRDLLDEPSADDNNNIMEDLYPHVYTEGDVIFYGIDTVVAAEDDFMHFAAGEVGDVQLDKFKTELALSSMDKIKVAYMHHHPFYRMVGLQMKDAQKVMEVMDKNVDILCFGHKHVPEVWLDRAEINWILAADKTTRLQATKTYDFRHVEILDKKRFVISTVHINAE